MADVKITGLTANGVALDGTELFEIVNAAGDSRKETLGDIAAYAANLVSTSTIPFIIDGGGVTITTGLKGYIQVDFDCEIQSATLLGDQSGSIVVDIWRTTYASFDPPTTPADGNSITSSTPPTISTAKKSTDSTLTSWTTTISAGDILAFNVDSVTSMTRVTLALQVLRT